MEIAHNLGDMFIVNQIIIICLFLIVNNIYLSFDNLTLFIMAHRFIRSLEPLTLSKSCNMLNFFYNDKEARIALSETIFLLTNFNLTKSHGVVDETKLYVFLYKYSLTLLPKFVL